MTDTRDEQSVDTDKSNIRVYDKLVRDGIPKLLTDEGKVCAYHIETGDMYLDRLRAKLLEEFDELEANPSVEEAADLYEVFCAIIDHHDLDMSRVVYDAANQKRRRLGGFSKGYVLELVYE